MPLRGNKPKPDDQRVTRHPLTQEWIEVPSESYAGPRPKCPVRIKATVEWWEDVTTQPHCILWTLADWRFVVDTARIHAQMLRGKWSLAGEVRIREKILGTTWDARRDLRIRYVPAAETEEQPEAVMSEEDEARWRRLLDEEDV